MALGTSLVHKSLRHEQEGQRQLAFINLVSPYPLDTYISRHCTTPISYYLPCPTCGQRCF